MKKRFLSVFALLLSAALLLSFSSCGMFRTIRENALLAKQRAIIDTPDDSQMADVYNEALANTLREATAVKENVSFSVGKPSVSSDTGDVSILSKAADTLKKMIMQEDPGSEERTLPPQDIADTLLKDLNGADVVSVSGTRVSTVENVTDADGKEVTDEEGNVLTQTVTVNNVLRAEYRFYGEEKKTETDENGNEKETVTLLPPDPAVIEKYFGAPREKAAVLAGLDGIKEYLQVNDYTLEYKDCRVKTVSELDTGVLESVIFEKKMAVTAQVTGVGALAHMGAFTVTFDLSENTEYTFTFPEQAE
jgi:hypothetical protein